MCVCVLGGPLISLFGAGSEDESTLLGLALAVVQLWTSQHPAIVSVVMNDVEAKIVGMVSSIIALTMGRKIPVGMEKSKHTIKCFQGFFPVAYLHVYTTKTRNARRKFSCHGLLSLQGSKRHTDNLNLHSVLLRRVLLKCLQSFSFHAWIMLVSFEQFQQL
ncbi:Uncharacterized protein TCM_006622 [Theobroma cacao]|uniref:Uncharacterized protein n=1 Tax=Theobroma cacao TaxID=3641 RepID=A0A061E602_THECC|nr:Uncharacterized protein TCM_006622 [Theobroma cacao]